MKNKNTLFGLMFGLFLSISFSAFSAQSEGGNSEKGQKEETQDERMRRLLERSAAALGNMSSWATKRFKERTGQSVQDLVEKQRQQIGSLGQQKKPQPKAFPVEVSTKPATPQGRKSAGTSPVALRAEEFPWDEPIFAEWQQPQEPELLVEGLEEPVAEPLIVSYGADQSSSSIPGSFEEPERASRSYVDDSAQVAGYSKPVKNQPKSVKRADSASSVDKDGWQGMDQAIANSLQLDEDEPVCGLLNQAYIKSKKISNLSQKVVTAQTINNCAWQAVSNASQNVRQNLRLSHLSEESRRLYQYTINLDAQHIQQMWEAVFGVIQGVDARLNIVIVDSEGRAVGPSETVANLNDADQNNLEGIVNMINDQLTTEAMKKGESAYTILINTGQNTSGQNDNVNHWFSLVVNQKGSSQFFNNRSFSLFDSLGYKHPETGLDCSKSRLNDPLVLKLVESLGGQKRGIDSSNHQSQQPVPQERPRPVTQDRASADQYSEQMATLIKMGFNYEPLNLRALQKFDGNLQQAMEFLSDQQNQRIYEDIGKFNRVYLNNGKKEEDLLNALFETDFNLEEAKEKLMNDYYETELKRFRKMEFDTPEEFTDEDFRRLLLEKKGNTSDVVGALLDKYPVEE